MVAVQSSRTDSQLLGLREEVRKSMDLVLNRLPDLSQQRDSLQLLEGSVRELGGGIRDLQDQLQAMRAEGSPSGSSMDLQALASALKPLGEAVEALQEMERRDTADAPAGPTKVELQDLQEGLSRQLRDVRDSLQQVVADSQASLIRQLDSAATRMEAALDRAPVAPPALPESGQAAPRSSAGAGPGSCAGSGGWREARSAQSRRDTRATHLTARKMHFGACRALLASRSGAGSSSVAQEQPQEGLATSGNSEIVPPETGGTPLVVPRPSEASPLAQGPAGGPQALSPAQAQERRENLGGKSLHAGGNILRGPG
eukprot:jgi/Botrbrau1/20895/Bobra.0135s0026.1